MEVKNLSLGQRCQLFREYTLGLTREEFSMKTGLSLNQINHFEHNRTRNMNILLGYIQMGFKDISNN